MTNFEVGGHTKLVGGRGEITKIKNRPDDGHLYIAEGKLLKLPNGLPQIEKLDSPVDRLTAGQIDSLFHYDLRERAIQQLSGHSFD